DDRGTALAHNSQLGAQGKLGMKRLLPPPAWLLLSAAFLHAQPSPVLLQSAAASQDALGSPGIDAGDYLYVSGQGPRRADGSSPTNFADQVRQSLDNVKRVVGTTGLTMDHVVYVQVYLESMDRYAELNEVFAGYFPKDPPARAVVGVARLPESPV